ncbi:DUF6153 family protein [Streptomyces sp. AC550_RSS872]|uniref:DUF6153 family protein n=1 Tax=Streptomyces sp. AC550_RSS872 TaxID=2823689 RepID=UPI001C252DCC|nr:DUF6153 family protein [Streptomyces sp. AC550_RSS872]
MTSSRSSRRPAGALFALLVLTVLAGILGMHALAPGGAPAPEHTMTMAHAPATEQAGAACSHTDGNSGHLAHADGTCAATGIGSAYTPPALASALPDAPAAAGVPISAPTSAVQSRAPPDLSELQLLRI